MHVIELLCLFFMALIFGGWMVTMVVFGRGYRRMSAAAYIEAEQTNSQLACKYFAPLLVLSALSGAAFLWKLGEHSSRTFYMSLISVILLVGTAIFVKVKVLPINDIIHDWSPTNPPAGWQAMRARWLRLHTVRTVLGATAFLLQTAAIIWK